MSGLFSELFAPIKKAVMSYTPEPEKFRRLLVRTGVILVPAIFFAAAQSTVFSRFRIFGAVPDLMIIFVLTLAMREGEKTGAVCGIFCGYLIEALCGTGLSLLPLVYFIVGAFAGIISRLYLSDSAAVFCLFAPCAVIIRAFTTFLYINAENFAYTPKAAFIDTILPEAAATAICAVFVFALTRLALKPLHLKQKNSAN